MSQAEGRTYGVEDVERVTGIPKRTLQRWDDEGLLTASATPRGRDGHRSPHRRYSESDMVRARLIAALRAHGLPGRRAALVARAVCNGVPLAC